MALHIIVTAKQVMDPETPAAAFRVDRDARRVVPPQNIPPVVNGFDEIAVEAALRIRDALGEAKITVISVGSAFSMDVMKKPLSMGADDLILLQDNAFLNAPDPFPVVRALVAAIKKVGPFDLIISGRQASDWDNGQVPLGIAESLGIPLITNVRKVEVTDGKVRVEKVVPSAYLVIEAPLPALVTNTEELGEPRYPTLRGIMTATRKKPTIWSASDLGINSAQLKGNLELVDLFVPEKVSQCEFVEGENEADAGRKLALKLREAKLI